MPKIDTSPFSDEYLKMLVDGIHKGKWYVKPNDSKRLLSKLKFMNNLLREYHITSRLKSEGKN